MTHEPVSVLLDSSAVSGTAAAVSERPKPTLRQRLRFVLGDTVLRKGMLSVFDQAVVSGTSFITSVLIGRLCSPNDLGVYYLALSVVLFLRGIQEQIISAPYAVYCHRHKGASLSAYTGSTLVHQFVLMGIAVACGAGTAAALSAGIGPAELAPAAWAVVGAVPFLLFREYLRQLAFGRLALRTAVLLDIGVAALQFGGLAVLAVLGELSVVSVYLVMGGACALAAWGWWRARRDEVVVQPSRVLPDWKGNWSFSRWALASHLVGCSTPYILPWFVAAVDGTAATGILAACNTLVGLANAFMMGLSNYLTPKAAQSFSEGGVHELRRILRKTAILFVVSIGGFALFCTVAGNTVAEFVYGPEFSGAGPVLTVLAFSLLAGSVAMTAGNGLWAMERPSANFRADICALLVTVMAAVTLTPPFGVLGAAAASLAGATTDAVIRCWTLRHLMRETQRGELRTKNSRPETGQASRTETADIGHETHGQ